LPPQGREGILALAGGADWIPAMAGVLHPPFSLFLPGEKERMRRARWKREKDGFTGDEGRAWGAVLEYE